MKRTTFSLMVFSGFLTLLIITVLLRMTPVTKVEGRWYTQEAIDKGAILFQLHCASCHGANAEGTRDWKKTDSLGNYPPPPLNGTAHAWHHDMSVLKRTIREGGARLGGTMPSFKDNLSNSDMEAVIAYFQSKWSERIYQIWNERNQDSGIPSLGSSKKYTDLSILKISPIVSPLSYSDIQVAKIPTPVQMPEQMPGAQSLKPGDRNESTI